MTAPILEKHGIDRLKFALDILHVMKEKGITGNMTTIKLFYPLEAVVQKESNVVARLEML